ncbi:uncharacterized protein E0L32_011326 [Thyridium curvatum]|uniref:Nitrogen regulatory protein areA GATA-like domain-containing protein n=1 Tax=Thyridium curvatum TaxID=1093900 RepID=A0A507BN92_9PEZI|nr:uncharacterized protein E0L32_011326 [Thyridium curvatum]TPX19009.1 hypothetical protein E0L32_011326 [Thyridium curvatum]
MAMLLPKGLVENTAEVYAEVASYPVIPPEKIYEYWHVYTTTFRKLIDPTAHRLENFWWHVWGSDRRYLSGPALARIYEEISKGPTFVPLRGPPNRYEGPPTPRFSAHELDRPRPGQHRGSPSSRNRVRTGKDLSGEAEEEDGKNDLTRPATLQQRTSSSAKPPPTHSILKKPRGPSTSGPRPTARFISPHGSEDEDGDNKDDEEPSSTSTAATGLEMQARSPSTKGEKKAQQHQHHHVPKKFVASTHSKRRPALPRRQSSQSSAGSEAGSHRAPTLAELRGVSAPRSQGSSESSAQSDLHLSAKAAGKRPMTRLSPDKRVAHRSHAHGKGPDRDLEEDDAEQAVAQKMSPQEDQISMPPPERQTPRNELHPSVFQKVPVLPLESPTGAPRMSRSQSHQEHPRPRRDDSVGRRPPHGLLASSVSAMSNVAARGTFDSEMPIPEPQTIPPPRTEPLHPGAIPISPGGLTSRPSATSLLESRFTPTQPSATPPVPFGRSKSQLTLLLEREKARGADTKPRHP